MRTDDFELTTLSSKGQMVIPKDIREKMRIKEGSVLAITAYPNKDMMVFKTIKKQDEKEELQIVKEAEYGWSEIKNNRFKKADKKDFLEDIRKW